LWLIRFESSLILNWLLITLLTVQINGPTIADICLYKCHPMYNIREKFGLQHISGSACLSSIHYSQQKIQAKKFRNTLLDYTRNLSSIWAQVARRIRHWFINNVCSTTLQRLTAIKSNNYKQSKINKDTRIHINMFKMTQTEND